jgi:hypothetical protein
VFVVGAGDDEIWPSDIFVQNIEFELRNHGGRDVELIYPNAGHNVGDVVPNQPELSTVADSIHGRFNVGGTRQADEAAHEDSRPRLLRFLARS